MSRAHDPTREQQPSIANCPSCGNQRPKAQVWQVQRAAFLVAYGGRPAQVCARCAAVIGKDPDQPRHIFGGGYNR